MQPIYLSVYSIESLCMHACKNIIIIVSISCDPTCTIIYTDINDHCVIGTDMREWYRC